MSDDSDSSGESGSSEGNEAPPLGDFGANATFKGKGDAENKRSGDSSGDE
jgi:hypothetical protein